MTADPETTRHRRWLIAGGYCVLAGAFLLVMLLHYRGVSVARANIESYRLETQQRLQTKKSLADVNEQIQNLQFQVRDYARLVPENQDLGAFLEQLAGELAAAGMKDVDIKNQAAITLGRCQKLPIELHAAGTFAQFQQFLVRVENFQRLSSVGRLVIDSADPDMNGKVKVDLRLFIYNSKPG